MKPPVGERPSQYGYELIAANISPTGWEMIHDYAAAQHGSPPPDYFFSMAPWFLLLGLYLIYKQRQWRREPSRLEGSALATPLARMVVLVVGWIGAVFGVLCLIVAG